MITIERKRELAHSAFVLILFVVVSAIFLWMIRGFLLPVLMAAIFAGMTYPIYARLTQSFRGRSSLAAAATTILVLLVVVIPLLLLTGIVVSQAVQVGESVVPWVREHLSQAGEMDELLQRIPFWDRLEPYREQVTRKLGEIAGAISSFFVSSISAATRATVGFLFNMFIMLFSMFFFLTHGKELRDHVLRYVPLPERDKALMLDKYVSVSRATLKGTLVIGIVQGGLAGLAFAVVGIKGAAFWGTIMAVLSIIPGVGTALVWVPAVIYLVAGGQMVAAVGLFVWCIAVVGTVDNFLRPVLVGKDTAMPELLILLSTLGGLSVFGAVGIVVGPVIAAIFLAVWKIYGEAFGDLLTPSQAPDTGAQSTEP
jgi:predicted PurR-regulated permease PerM